MRTIMLFGCLVAASFFMLDGAAAQAGQLKSGHNSLAQLRKLEREFRGHDISSAADFYDTVSLRSNIVPSGMAGMTKRQLAKQLPISTEKYQLGQKKLLQLWHAMLQPLAANVEATKGDSRLAGGFLRKARVQHRTYFDDPTLEIAAEDTTDLSDAHYWTTLGIHSADELERLSPGIKPRLERYERLLGRGYETLSSPLDESAYALGTLHLPPGILNRTRDPIYVVDLKTAGEQGPFTKVEVIPSSDDRQLDLLVTDLEGSAYELPILLK